MFGWTIPLLWVILQVHLCALSPLSCCVISFSKGCSHPHLSKDPQWDSVLLPSLTHLLSWHHSAGRPAHQLMWILSGRAEMLRLMMMPSLQYIWSSERAVWTPEPLHSNLKPPVDEVVNFNINTHTHSRWKLQPLYFRLLTTLIFTPTGSSRFPNCFRKGQMQCSARRVWRCKWRTGGRGDKPYSHKWEEKAKVLHWKCFFVSSHTLKQCQIASNHP